MNNAQPLTALKALVWEFIQESWLTLAGILSMLMAGPVAFAALIGMMHGAEADDLPQLSLQYFVNYLGIAAFALIVPSVRAVVETARRNRTLPVSTRFLAGFLFMMPLVVAAAANLLVQLFYIVMFGTSWPIVTTTLSVMMFLMVVSASAWWLRDFSTWKLLVVPLLVGSCGYWILSHSFEDPWLHGQRIAWSALSLSDGLILVLVGIACWVVQLRSYGRFRCGDARRGWLFDDMLQPEVIVTSRLTRDVERQTASPFEALLVMNRNSTVGWRTCVCALVPILYLMTAGLVLRTSHGNILGSLLLLMAVICVICGLSVTGYPWLDKTGGLRSFAGTLPISNRDISRVLQRNYVTSAAIGWAVIASVAVLLIAGYGIAKGREALSDDYFQLVLFEHFGHWWLLLFPIGTLVLTILTAGVVAAIAAVGRTNLFVWLIGGVYGGLLTGFILNMQSSDWTQILAKVIWIGMAVAAGGLVTAFVFIRGLSQGLVTSGEAIASLIAATILCGLIVLLVPFDTSWKIVWCGLAGLFVTPVAAIPCGLQINRHR